MVPLCRSIKRYRKKKAVDEACHDIIGVLYPVVPLFGLSMVPLLYLVYRGTRRAIQKKVSTSRATIGLLYPVPLFVPNIVPPIYRSMHQAADEACHDTIGCCTL